MGATAAINTTGGGTSASKSNVEKAGGLQGFTLLAQFWRMDLPLGHMMLVKVWKAQSTWSAELSSIKHPADLLTVTFVYPHFVYA